jgi:hypothetical protein
MDSISLIGFAVRFAGHRVFHVDAGLFVCRNHAKNLKCSGREAFILCDAVMVESHGGSRMRRQCSQIPRARRLMLTKSLDAAEAGFQVGSSHFSREY